MPRTRFSDDDRLKIIGLTREEAEEFTQLFAPDRPLYVRTRGKSQDPRDWYTPYGRLTLSQVIRHLTGARIPHVHPVWVAPKCWEASQWVGIDVDFRGDRRDFKSRCRQVEKALWRLGVYKKAWLVTKTPSGGRHYRFFLKQKALVVDIAWTLELAGIQECSGRFEIFPKRNQGMRLPCGQCDPKHPRELLQELRTGARPRINWFKCRKRAQNHATRTRFAAPTASPSTTIQERSPALCSNPRPTLSTKAALTACRRPANLATDDRSDELYQRLLVEPATPTTMQQLLDCGIQRPGTRVQATKRLAWHLVRVRGLSVDEASSILTEWAHRTGAKTSKDVQADLAKRTTKVADQTRSIVEYCAQLEKPKSGTCRTGLRISHDEVDAVLRALSPHSAEDALTSVKFALYFLQYARTHGIATPGGWEAIISAGGVMRRWPGFSGNKYVQARRTLEGCGLIEMTKQKRQSNTGQGRPRTYRICIPCELAAGATLGIDDALAYGREQLATTRIAPPDATRSHLPNDRYKGFEKPCPKEERDDLKEAPLAQIRTVFEEMDSIGNGAGTTFSRHNRTKRARHAFRSVWDLPQNPSGGSIDGLPSRTSRARHDANRDRLETLSGVFQPEAAAVPCSTASGSRSPISPTWVPQPGLGIPKRFRLQMRRPVLTEDQLATPPP